MKNLFLLFLLSLCVLSCNQESKLSERQESCELAQQKCEHKEEKAKMCRDKAIHYFNETNAYLDSIKQCTMCLEMLEDPSLEDVLDVDDPIRANELLVSQRNYYQDKYDSYKDSMVQLSNELKELE